MAQPHGAPRDRAHGGGGLALGFAAWRLQLEPLHVPWLARQLEAQFNTLGGPTRLDIGDATIAWAGWREGHRSPLEIALRHVRAVDRDGAVRADLPDAAVSLSAIWLLRGVVAPRSLEMRGLSLRALRAADGGFRLDLGSLDEEGTDPDAPADDQPERAAILAVLAELMLPPSENTPLSALHRVSLTDSRLIVADAQLGRSWSAHVASIDLTRRAGGGIDLIGMGALSLGPEQVGLRISGSIEGATGQGYVTLAVPSIRPAALARAAPMLGALAALDAQASLALEVRLDGLRIPAVAQARLRVGHGMIDLGARGRVPLSAFEADIALDQEHLRIERAELRPAPPPGGGAGPPPVIRARGEVRREGAAWRGEASLALDRVAFADLAHYWPAGIAHHARDWMVENITAGVARAGTWRVAVEGDPLAGRLAVTEFEGSAEAEGATVHWLRPIPPAEGASGRARFGLDVIEIEVAEGRQSASGLVVREGRIRFGFETDPETAEMEFVVGGPLADAWTILRHPRLALFERRPPPVASLTGTLREARVQIAFPLIVDLPVSRLRVSASGRGTEVRVPRAVFGRDLDRGSFEFAADNDGLRVTGTATMAGVALRIQQEADFRPGPANQVVGRETVTGIATAAQIADVVLDLRPFVEGRVGLDIRTESRRNGQGRVNLRADLTRARLSVDALAWAKAEGVAGTGEAAFTLRNGALTGIEGIRVDAPGTVVRARGTQVRQNIPQRIEIQQGQLGRSRFTGDMAPPQGRNGAWTIGLQGQVLDLAPALEAPAAAAAATGAAHDQAGPTVNLDLRFDRMLLREGQALSGVVASARVDGAGVLQAADLRGQVERGGAVLMRIAPEGTRRRVTVTSDDGGSLLRAFGVLRTVQGGRLNVDAVFAHGRPGAPLIGSAELEDFALRDAPALGKLLQAMSVYGVFEALSGQGLNFASLTAPFVLTREALVLDDARAFSASLGLTAKGRIDRLRNRIDMEGTIVPAYVFNSLLGRIPVLGRLFSPERGGGLFAATYRMRGPLADPSVSVNPLAALTPGFLRGVFGIGQDDVTAAPPAAPQ